MPNPRYSGNTAPPTARQPHRQTTPRPPRSGSHSSDSTTKAFRSTKAATRSKPSKQRVVYMNYPSDCHVLEQKITQPVSATLQGAWNDSVLKDIQRMVATNNAFEVVHILLSSCQNIRTFQREIEIGNVDRVRQAIGDSMLRHIEDHGLFTIHAIISVGVISESRSLDRMLEKAISKLLSDPLRRILSSRRSDIQNQESRLLSSNSQQHSLQCPASKSAIAGIRGGENDLIIWDDDIMSEPDRTSPAQGRKSNNINLLDDDDNSISGTDCLPPLQPIVPPHRSLASKEPCREAISPQIPGSTMSRSGGNFRGNVYHTDRKDDDKLLDFWSGDRNALNSPDANRLSQVIALDPQHQRTSTITSEQPCGQQSANTNVSDAKEQNILISTYSSIQCDRPKGFGECPALIQPKHQQLLLNEIAAGKSILQVCAVLDIFNMRQCLSDTIPNIEHRVNDTFGSSLVRQLLDMEELDEAIAVVKGFIETRDRDIDLEILAQLMIAGDITRIHEFVGELHEVCTVALQYIDMRFSALIARWDQAGYFDHYSNPAYIDPLPTAVPSTEMLDQMLESKTGVRVALVEIAMSLIIRFDLEDSLLQSNTLFHGISFFAQYCTAITLLHGMSASGVLKTNSRHGKQAMENEGFTMLQSSWMILPYVIRLVRDDRRVQCMIIRHCILEQHDQVIAGFLAAKLDLGSVYQKWMHESDTVVNSAETTRGQRIVKPGVTEATEMIGVNNASSLDASPPNSRRHSNIIADPDDIKALFWSSNTEKSSPQISKPPSTPNLLSTHQTVNLSSTSTVPRGTSQKMFYSLPPETKVVIINHLDQFDQLRNSLSRSRVVGMDSEWLPTEGQNSWLQVHNLEMLRGSGEDGIKTKSSTPRTALLQLACDYMDCVYVIDTTKFDEDPSNRLGILLGDMFSNPAIQKIAYNWEHDKRLLERTFPILAQKRYRLQNFIDLRFIWLRFRDVQQTLPENMDRFDISKNNSNNENGYANPLEAWSKVPQGPPMRRFLFGGLSNMVQMLCGKPLDKTEQCSNWERRPLTKNQLHYAVVDARCLLDIHEILERAQRID
ncbi:Exonuclease mut-7 [Entomortierella chlamydospora]|uniref:Exonuclease mut-7 n=1 Tax=Entomortierella chlamydospora TaxID=101097 RepID=A0A9P6MU08_9FUNG|nr:Exonuclease mut-7 [Entomortierella chlamydospora]